MSHWRSQLDNYHGSTVLTPAAQLVGVQVDKLNFLVAGFTSIGLGYLYAKVLPVGTASVATRKVVLMVLGLSILYFCYGRDVLHVVAEAILGYVLMKTVPISKLPQFTLMASLGYQSICHIIRQYTDPDGYTIDITGAIMMLTQRLSTLAFSLRDGAQPEGTTTEQQRDAVKEQPDALTYFAYMFDFHEILAGPLITYNEFLRIAEGRNLQSGKPAPSPHREVLRKVGYVILNAMLILFVVPKLTDVELLSSWFSELPFFTKLLYLNVFSFLSRVQYYLVWKMSEAVCNSSGYGFYVTPEGEERWDGADNIHIFKLETGPSLKVVLDNWNVSTQRWLKHVCYDRKVQSKTVMTFFISAVWHGFYPGYFLSFMTCSLFVMSSRKIRRCVRPRVVKGPLSQMLYDVVTFAFSSSFLAYTTAPFVMLQFGKAWHLWREMYFFGHILALLAFAVPYILPPPRTAVASKETEKHSSNGKLH